MPRIIYLSDIGFCKGLETVIKRLKVLKDKKEHVFSIAPILHNENEYDKLKKEYGISDVLQEDSFVIFPAHGHTIEEEKEFDSYKTIDTICPIVKSNLDFIKANKDKYGIIYFGNKKHRETTSVLSYAKDICAVETYDELENALKKTDNPYVIFQSTTDLMVYEKCESLLNSKNIPYRGLCSIYLNRIHEAVNKLSDCHPESSTVLVLGSTTSSNCNSIKNYIKTKYPYLDTYMINSVDELDSIALKENVYITSATSISKESIAKIIKAIG